MKYQPFLPTLKRYIRRYDWVSAALFLSTEIVVSYRGMSMNVYSSVEIRNKYISYFRAITPENTKKRTYKTDGYIAEFSEDVSIKYYNFLFFKSKKACTKTRDTK